RGERQFKKVRPADVFCHHAALEPLNRGWLLGDFWQSRHFRFRQDAFQDQRTAKEFHLILYKAVVVSLGPERQIIGLLFYLQPSRRFKSGLECEHPHCPCSHRQQQSKRQRELPPLPQRTPEKPNCESVCGISCIDGVIRNRRPCKPRGTEEMLSLSR